MYRKLAGIAGPSVFCCLCMALALAESSGGTCVKLRLQRVLAPALSRLDAVRFPIPAGADQGFPGAEGECDGERARLLRENSVLREQLADMGAAGGPRDSGFRFESARVLRLVGWNGDRRLAVIDLGTRHGIRAGMGAIKGDAAVGKVLECGPDTSLVRFLTDSGCKAAVTVTGCMQHAGADPVKFEGVAEGRAGEPGRIRLLHLGVSVPVAAGDCVLTSGRFGDFPAGLVAGWVESVDNDEYSQFHGIVMRPALAYEGIRSLVVAVPASFAGAGEVGR